MMTLSGCQPSLKKNADNRNITRSEYITNGDLVRRLVAN